MAPRVMVWSVLVGLFLVMTACRTGLPVIEMPANPDALPYSTGSLTLSGLRMDVDVRKEVHGDRLIFRLFSHGDEVERETYAYRSGMFSLESIGEDEFDPVIPLLKLYQNPGIDETWKGRLKSKGETHSASAVIVVLPETLNISGGPYQSARVGVRLTIDPESATPAKREMNFWFAPRHGMIKRQIGLSTREPK